jgi:[amino group carrier protein]-lysine/ornithine hydrolase
MTNEIGILEGLLRAYSPSGQERGAVEFLTAEMTRLGFSAHIDAAGNAVGSFGEGQREIVLLGHIDTVPGQIAVRAEDGKLYGRGSVDAKGPLACFTAAAARVGARPDWKITVIGAVGEEANSPGAKAIVDKYRPEMVIIGEPSGWDHICLGYKGSAWFHYQVNRPLAHTAAKAESACEAAVGFWNRAVAFCQERNTGQERAFFQLTPTLRGMKSSSDGFNDNAEVMVGFRLPPDLTPKTLAQQIQGLVGEYGQLEMVDWVLPYRAEKNTPLVRAFLAAIRAAGGLPAFSLKTGTADMNIVAPAWGCPAAAYGPGDSDLDHTPNEHIQIAEFEQGVTVLEAALRILTS